MGLDFYEKKATVERIEGKLRKFMIDPSNLGAGREEVVRRRARLQAEIEELDFVEDATAFVQKWARFFNEEEITR